MIAGREIGKRLRIGLLARARETRRARSNRRRPEACRPAARASARMRSQRSGDFTTRRSDGKPCASRNRAVTPLAAIIRFSISAFARFGACGRTSRSVSPSNTGSTSIVSKSSAPCSCAHARRAPARRRSCMRSCSSMPGTAAAAGGSGRRRPARRRRRCRRASPGCARARRRRPTPSASPSADDDELDDDRETILAVVERREIGRQPLGQHRKDRRRACRPTSC